VILDQAKLAYDILIMSAWTRPFTHFYIYFLALIVFFLYQRKKINF